MLFQLNPCITNLKKMRNRFKRRTEEEGVAGKYGSVVAITGIVADGSLGVTVSPESLDGDISDLELFPVLDDIVDLGNAGIGTVDGETWLLGNEFDISAGVVPVVMCAEDGGEFGAEVLENMHQLLWLDGVDHGGL